MNDLLIKVSKRSRLIDLDHSTLGIVGENLQEKLIFIFQDEFVDGMARLEYELDGEKHYVLMEKVGQSYILPVQNVLLTKEGNIDLQLVITEDKTGTPVFKSEVFTLYCKKSIEAVGEAPSSYELWIEKANRILLEASRVNIDGKKTGNETIITITQRDGNKKSFPILDGKDGADGQDGNSIVSIEKTSTSGLVDTYTITFTDGTTTTYTVTNGETPDLSNYVQKTEFNESQAEQDTTTRELQAELDRYKLLENALPHTENETANDYVTLENTAKSPMEVTLIPQTSQETTTGKNKLGLVDGTYINNGVQAVVSNGTITVTGTATSTSFVSIPLLSNIVLSNEQVTISINNTATINDSATEFRVYESGANYMPVQFTSANNKVTYTKTGTYVSAYVRTTSGVSYGDGFIIKPQLELGSEATSYEPYTGGIPSPNPDYPEDIHRTTGENEIDVTGKNLLDRTQCEEDKILTWTTGIVTSNTDSLASGFILVNANDKIISTYKSQVMFYQNDKTYIGCLQTGGTAIAKTGGDYFSAFTIPNESSIKYIRLGFRSSVNNHANMKTANIMVNKGTTLLDYVPYESATYPISLGEKEMFNINGVYDGFVYDEATDKFYINRKIGKVVLNGSESWDSLVSYDHNGYYCDVNGILISDNNTNPALLLSNYFKGYSVNDLFQYNLSNNGIVRRTNQTQIIVRNDNVNSLNDFKIWLSSHNTTINYIMGTTILEEITDTTLISQLRAIKNALSMQGATHIISTSTGTNLPFLIKARAVQTIERT